MQTFRASARALAPTQVIPFLSKDIELRTVLLVASILPKAMALLSVRLFEANSMFDNLLEPTPFNIAMHPSSLMLLSLKRQMESNALKFKIRLRSRI